MRFGAVFVSVLVVACSLQVPPNVDRDNDHHRDGQDNCEDVANPDQSDFDGDGDGDACDVCDMPGDNADVDKDMIPDACDGCIGDDVDDDDDGIPDNCDACVATGEDDEDIDVDGIPDACDTCIAIGGDMDGDGLVDACDPCNKGPQDDEDGDGVMDACDNCKATPNPLEPNPDPSQPPIQPDTMDDAGIGFVNDGVGDACDKDPFTNRETFDGFNAQNAKWYVQGSGWALENGTLTGMSPSVTQRSLDAGNESFSITTAVAITFSATNPNIDVESFVGVYASPSLLQLGTTTRVECGVGSFSDNAGAMLRVATYENDTLFDEQYVALVPATSYVIRLSMPASKPSCDVNEATQGVSVSSTSGLWYTGLKTTGGAIAAFRYFDLITR